MDTLIDINDYLQRDKLIWNPAQYPKDIDEAVGFLVKERRDVLPSYHPTPGSMALLMHAGGYMSDEVYERMEKACGADLEPQFNIHLCVAGNQKCWGNNLYRSLLMMGNSFNKEEALAFDGDGDWDYRFLPGIIRLGRTGRVVDGSDEKLSVNIASDLVYSSITDGGIHIDSIVMLMSDGTERIIYENEKMIESMFPAGKNTNEWQKYNHLITLPELSGVVRHPFAQETADMHHMYVFETERSFDSLEALADTYAAETDNIVWKLGGLPIKMNDPNNFLVTGTWHMRYSPCMWEDSVGIGSTGRKIRTQHLLMDNGCEAPACWQSEYVNFHVSRDMICQALLELPDIKSIAMYKDYNDPWEIVYESDGSASPSNKKPYVIATEKPSQPSDIERFLNDIAEDMSPRGIMPEEEAN